jgi:hypothetical protein
MSTRIVLAVLALFVVAGWLVRWSRRRGLEIALSRRSAELVGFRAAVRWRWAGLAVGVTAAAKTASVGSLGLGLMLAPTVFGFVVIAGVVAGELATIPRRQGVRTAALETRTVGRYLPRGLSGVVLASTVSLGVLLVTTTLMGSADDMGRPGRSLFRQCTPQTSTGQISTGAGPWPGFFYSVPLAIAVLVGVLGVAVALRKVVLRPRRGSAPELVVADDVLRRRSAEAVVAAAGVMVAPSLLGVALTAGGALIGFVCAPAWWTVLGFGLLTVAMLMFLLLAWCLVLLLTGPRIPSNKSGDAVRATEGVPL